MKPLYVAFLWHMHQPYYKDLLSNKLLMPWVRLHGIKDYYDMVAILEEFPNIHQTFNLVPSLISQIEDYVNNTATDIFLDLTIKPAKDLANEEKIFILKNFFMVNWDTMIKIHPRYADLLEKRGYYFSEKELAREHKNFTTQDFLDLQVWFNLAWFDPVFLNTDSALKELATKGKNYKEKDKEIVIQKQREVLSKIVLEYKKLSDIGQIELTTSPFYHPILPLLCDTNIAKVSQPNLNIDDLKFSHPEDAQSQVKKAISFHKEHFGIEPKGMWPSEGSVSDSIVPILAKAGIKWIATDEEILFRSISQSKLQGYPLYKPYRIVKDGNELDIIFRDHNLSDTIGFVYSKWDPNVASEHFISKLREIRNNVAGEQNEHLVCIALDGENAWEYYKNDGRDFLMSLYSKLNNNPEFKLVTVSEFLNAVPYRDTLTQLFPGSWINSNFHIWIGHHEDQQAWRYLKETRDALVEYEKTQKNEKSKLAWEEIYIAEGSDWCWWFGDDHSSANDEEFDSLYRKHLMNVYEFLDLDIPAQLFVPILEEKVISPTLMPAGLINPIIDGGISNFYEWSSAGFYDVSKIGGTMHRAETITKGIYYGFNLDMLFLRIDTNLKLSDKFMQDFVFEINFVEPVVQKLRLKIPSEKEQSCQFCFFRLVNDVWQDIENSSIHCAIKKIIEIKIPFAALLVKPEDKIRILLSIKKGDDEIERWPLKGVIDVLVPTVEYEAIMWHV